MLFGKRKTPPIQLQFAPFVVSANTLTASTINTLRSMLQRGIVVILCKSIHDYTDTGHPLLFGDGVTLRFDPRTGMVTYQFLQHTASYRNVEYTSKVGAFKLSDGDKLNEIFDKVTPYAPEDES